MHVCCVFIDYVYDTINLMDMIDKTKFAVTRLTATVTMFGSFKNLKPHIPELVHELSINILPIIQVPSRALCWTCGDWCGRRSALQ